MVVGIEVGARVYARWPGSSLFYEGTVVDKNDIEYLVKFDDEDNSELPVKYKDVNVSKMTIMCRPTDVGICWPTGVRI